MTYFCLRLNGLVGGFVSDTSFAHFSYALVDFISPIKVKYMVPITFQKRKKRSFTREYCYPNSNYCQRGKKNYRNANAENRWLNSVECHMIRSNDTSIP